MESRQDLKSILPYLPLLIRSSSLSWPSEAMVEALKAMARGPSHSGVNSGEVLFLAISDLRNHTFYLSSDVLAPFAPYGYALFFDDLMSKEESTIWFEQIVPALANLLLRFPSLLETHYQQHAGSGRVNGVQSGLRLLPSQEPGIVFLSQELIGALVGCSLFCLFPVSNRDVEHLPMINFDHMFASLYDSYKESQENKIRCIIHYFERICSYIPMGYVSFERKVLALEHRPPCIPYPKDTFWSNSVIPLCRFEVQNSGLIEDQSGEALEVDFANKYIGGGALNRGCVQEEIRFMTNPELIAGMLFLPSMADNEAIEIIGAERFSSYNGYASSFRFSGDYVDKRDVDCFGRHKTRIIAIDALCNPRLRQYRQECLLRREINKAFCGFFDQSKSQQYERLFQERACSGAEPDQSIQDLMDMSGNNLLLHESTYTSDETNKEISLNQVIRNYVDCQNLGYEDNFGIVTGNWGCGAFGGDPELKTIIQWLAASQALRPFISYYTFGLKALQNLDQVTRWILSHQWTVGDLWNMLVDYSYQKYNGQTSVGFFTWLLPSLHGHDTLMSDLPNMP
ncbi:poly(ADP-ribose) glycohydrolase 1 isoform X1 [Juglans microcarpa x Juglans regia]|uniref:poly(ADP-ribose) glycohydrolase 1 isoform X1 n=1 Tax=Juglans microcarpa x Juglans regia TaxID=2249226 RepID=UPI001B7E9B17|nr:poly(ADP-ribose) glycohydrolase 1 isoform X1 [Juglans microcarpa x Juglans regia]